MNLNIINLQKYSISKYSYLRGTANPNDNQGSKATICADSANEEISLQAEQWFHHPARTELSIVFSTHNCVYDIGLKSAPVIIQLYWKDELLEYINLQEIEASVNSLNYNSGPLIISIVRMPSIGIKYLEKTAQNQMITNRLQIRFDDESSFNGVLGCLKSYGINHRIINPRFDPTFALVPIAGKQGPIRSSTVASFLPKEKQVTEVIPKIQESTLRLEQKLPTAVGLKRNFTTMNSEARTRFQPPKINSKKLEPQFQSQKLQSLPQSLSQSQVHEFLQMPLQMQAPLQIETQPQICLQASTSVTEYNRSIPIESILSANPVSENTLSYPMSSLPIPIPVSNSQPLPSSQSSNIYRDLRDKSISPSFLSSGTSTNSTEITIPEVMTQESSRIEELVSSIPSSIAPFTSSDRELRSQILQLLQEESFIDFVEKVDKIWNSLANK